MGDLSGGQMIKKKVPGSGTMFDFADKDTAKEIIRSRINDSMADEAKICFDFATSLFKEMINE
jgi:heme oxygenase